MTTTKLVMKLELNRPQTMYTTTDATCTGTSQHCCCIFYYINSQVDLGWLPSRCLQQVLPRTLKSSVNATTQGWPYATCWSSGMLGAGACLRALYRQRPPMQLRNIPQYRYLALH